jgi:hypothetical protein
VEEIIGRGTYCSANNRPRRTKIIYTCDEDKNSLMRILNVEEDEICEYTLLIGTALLCNDLNEEEDIVRRYSDAISCYI